MDLSHPMDRSVNDGISRERCSVTYASVDDAVRLITILGRGTLILKIDLKNAYRIVLVHPDNRHLLGIHWQGETYIDQALPFGLHSAPLLFTAVADAVSWALIQAGTPPLIHYLDDFLFFLPATEWQSDQALHRILGTLNSMGVPVAMQKVEGPATSITFLGILIDTVRFELRLPPEKVSFIQGIVRS